MEGSVFKHPHRVTYGECTVGNHVYYSRYLDILEEARGEFFRHLGSPLRALQEVGLAFPVIGMEISYKGMARYDDLIAIELWFSQLAGIRMTFGFRIINAEGNLLAEGETRHICATIEEKATRIPRDLMEKLQPYVHPASHAT